MSLRDKKWLCERAILTPTNNSVQVVNEQLLYLRPGEFRICRSFYSFTGSEQTVNYPIDFCNSLELSRASFHTSYIETESQYARHAVEKFGFLSNMEWHKTNNEAAYAKCD